MVNLLSLWKNNVVKYCSKNRAGFQPFSLKPLSDPWDFSVFPLKL